MQEYEADSSADNGALSRMRDSLAAEAAEAADSK